MIPLRDEITLSTDASGVETVGEPIPAYVGFSSSKEGWGSTAFNREDLVVIIEPGSIYDPHVHWVNHRGTTYDPNGPAAVHYQHGEPHHVTIPLVLVTEG